MADCPEFFNDQVPRDLPALERHVEECDRCRDKLERIVRQQMGDLPSDMRELAPFATRPKDAPPPPVKPLDGLRFEPQQQHPNCAIRTKTGNLMRWKYWREYSMATNRRV